MNVLDDIQKAIEYCEQVYNSNSKDKNKVRFFSHDLILFICYDLFYLFCKIFFGLTSHMVPLWPYELLGSCIFRKKSNPIQNIWIDLEFSTPVSPKKMKFVTKGHFIVQMFNKRGLLKTSTGSPDTAHILPNLHLI